jgi:hypothetical protein
MVPLVVQSTLISAGRVDLQRVLRELACEP